MTGGLAMWREGRSSLADRRRAALYVAPLCPAGHLPHKGGDHAGRLPFANLQRLEVGDILHEGVISPLVGEMSGRTEGGNVERCLPGHNGASNSLCAEYSH